MLCSFYVFPKKSWKYQCGNLWQAAGFPHLLPRGPSLGIKFIVSLKAGESILDNDTSTIFKPIAKCSWIHEMNVCRAKFNQKIENPLCCHIPWKLGIHSTTTPIGLFSSVATHKQINWNMTLNFYLKTKKIFRTYWIWKSLLSNKMLHVAYI